MVSLAQIEHKTRNTAQLHSRNMTVDQGDTCKCMKTGRGLKVEIRS